MFKVSCANCNNSKEFSQINENILDFKNIHHYYYKFICTKCGAKKINIHADDKLVLDNERLTICQCGFPIILQRLELDKNKIKTCIHCKENSEKPPVDPIIKKPEIPAKYRRCPSGHLAVIQMNKSNDSFFIGCSEFSNPKIKCMWTKPLYEN